MRLLNTPLARMTLAAALCCAPAPAAGAPPAAPKSAGGSTAATVRIPIGHVRLDTDDTNRKLGDTFGLVVRSGAKSCYVEALRNDPNQQGEIAFVVRQPAGEGHYLVTLESRGSIEKALVACVDRVFGGLYHYKDEPAFDRVAGTLRLEPEWISAPARPTPEAARAALDQIYSPPDIVRIANVVLRSVSEESDPSSPEVRRTYIFDVDLVFRADGYEADCHHYELYKVFSKGPYASRYAGHSCENHPRKAGDRAGDTTRVVFRLNYYPSVATSWKLVGGSR
jgi:hypothetical protein